MAPAAAAFRPDPGAVGLPEQPVYFLFFGGGDAQPAGAADPYDPAGDMGPDQQDDLVCEFACIFEGRVPLPVNDTGKRGPAVRVRQCGKPGGVAGGVIISLILKVQESNEQNIDLSL